MSPEAVSGPGEQTKDLMVSFYTNLMRRNMTKGEALRKAQLEMANKGVDPYYFAAFQLFGDPGPLGK